MSGPVLRGRPPEAPPDPLSPPRRHFPDTQSHRDSLLKDRDVPSTTSRRRGGGLPRTRGGSLEPFVSIRVRVGVDGSVLNPRNPSRGGWEYRSSGSGNRGVSCGQVSVRRDCTLSSTPANDLRQTTRRRNPSNPKQGPDTIIKTLITVPRFDMARSKRNTHLLRQSWIRCPNETPSHFITSQRCTNQKLLIIRKEKARGPGPEVTRVGPQKVTKVLRK